MSNTIVRRLRRKNAIVDYTNVETVYDRPIKTVVLKITPVLFLEPVMDFV